MNDAIGLGIGDRNPRLGQRDILWMPYRINFTVGEANFKGLERLPVQPFSNGVHVHSNSQRKVRDFMVFGSTPKVYHARNSKTSAIR
jgi:hypothetical protein